MHLERAVFAQLIDHIPGYEFHKCVDPTSGSESLGFDLDNTVYALDSTAIDLCLSVFTWARFRARKVAIKLHTPWMCEAPVPTFIEVSDRKLHDVNILGSLVPEADSFYVMDRADVDFAPSEGQWA